MTIEFLYENGKGSVVHEYGRSEPMYSIQWTLLLMRSNFRLEILSSYTPYWAQLPSSPPRRVNDRDSASGKGSEAW